MASFYEWDAQQKRFELTETTKDANRYTNLLHRLDCHNSLFGLCFGKSARLAVLMSSVRDSGNAFSWLDPDADDQFVKSRCMRMRVKVILACKRLSWPPDLWTFDTDSAVWVAYLPYSDSLDVFGSRFVYSICTSGTTGEPKIVHVPADAIMPNVHDFVSRFKLNANSKLMWSTSLDFDPSFLELLLALEARCLLFVVEELDLKRIWRFSSMISAVRPTFLQITPAILGLFSNEFLFELFGPQSPAKNLLIGGDTFPTAFVLRYARNCSADIHNVYGLTEVSCWASCTQFDPNVDEIADASDAIQDTKLVFNEDDGVEIRGRSCIVDGERRSSVQTKDQFKAVERQGRKRFVITSRKKINGVTITREVEEFLLTEFDFVDLARLVVFDSQLFVFIKRSKDSNEEVLIPDKFNIRSIFYINQFPITTNGKVDDNALTLHIAANREQSSGVVLNYLRNNPTLRNSDSTIASLGFSSRDLFEFIFECTSSLNYDAEKSKLLRRKLFDELTSISFLFHLGADFLTNRPTKEASDAVELRLLEKEVKCCSVNLLKRYSMKQCVDFSAEFYDNRIFVGDMSGYFAIIDTKTDRVCLRNEHDAAVTSKCLIHAGRAVYCTVDGQAHVVELNSLHTTSLQVGPSIRADPCVFDENNVFFAAFCTNLILMEVVTGHWKNVCELQSGLIRNAPLVSNEFVVVCTIDGVLAGFCRQSLEKFVWCRRLSKTVFASLFELPCNDLFGVVTLDGDLHFLKISSGEITKTYNFNTSCSIQPTVMVDRRIVLIPCAQDLVKVLRLNDEDTDAETYRLPLQFLHKSRFVYSSKLQLPLLKCTQADDPCCKLLAVDFERRHIELLVQLDSPSFGDPLIIEPTTVRENWLITGARDNFVYVFEMTTKNKFFNKLYC